MVGVQPDAGAERRLEEVTIGRRGSPPGDRLDVGCQDFRIVNALLSELLPRIVRVRPYVYLAI